MVPSFHLLCIDLIHLFLDFWAQKGEDSDIRNRNVRGADIGIPGSAGEKINIKGAKAGKPIRTIKTFEPTLGTGSF